ncbi:MAG: hypothetical protein JO290_10255 [Sphingomonadaceae bacterium]|nr:hypothetical protein [Sphingomonadaceae bacterium]
MRMIVLAGSLLVASSAVAQTDPVPPVQPPAPLEAAAASEKVICRSTVETGSLVKRHKVCLTKRQWVVADRENSNAARHMIESNASGARPN